MRRWSQCALLVLALTAAATPAMAQIVVTNAWVRATVAGQDSTAAYLVINSDRDVALVGASSDVSGHAAIHEMRMHGNMMMMPIERLAVPAGHAVTLDEHNYHIMLEKLSRQVKPGEKIVLARRFVDAKGVGQEVKVVATVRELTAHGGKEVQEGHMNDNVGY